MQIGASSLYTEMQTMKGEITPSISPQNHGMREINNVNSSNFNDVLANAIGNVNQLQATAGDLSTRLEMGDTSVTLSDTVIAREKASVAFEATVQVRNKLVDAYKQIMNMPV
ncbi:flagellar hook-basal body complex protein FliE [Parashewanella curva]|uniref:Flagellar hook-basal body complex protein FliE n=1 Tax=Parashewanella curva TaxID=2338552 RepID=A0A3L8Q389_9GAMM|nr:flagellar hook-basal body complex protein FliE [Parashewanella curva]RLV61639.1 flagellar hook-basal body complex protein FliE [Parashewanella curva]